MERIHILAAELYSYSFANYENHLGIGNVRFEKLMPDYAATLEKAESESWTAEQIAEAIDVDVESVEELRVRIRRALAIVDADSPAQAFRIGVRHCIQDALAKGLDGDAVENLVSQICYRASDLSVLLDVEGTDLSVYSDELREEPTD